MESKNQNTLFTLAISLLILLNEAPLALAESGSSSPSTSSQTTSAPIGLLITYWICNGQKRKAIGGWLLFYYMQLFGSAAVWILVTISSMDTLAENLNLTNWSGETMRYFLYILSIIPADILLIVELVFGSMLLSRKFRNRKVYNVLRIIFAAQFGFGIISYLIDSSYWVENVISDVLPIVISAFWFLYFTLSKRIKMVFIENTWNPDIVYSQIQGNDSVRYNMSIAEKHYGKAKKIIKSIQKNITAKHDTSDNKCHTCKKQISSLDYKCPHCGEVFWKSKEAYSKYMEKHHEGKFN